METTLKQCCDMAPMLALKKSNIIPTVPLANAELNVEKEDTINTVIQYDRKRYGATSLTHATHNSFMVHWPASSFSMILMKKGEADQFKGKTLDEINLNSEENLMDTANYVENETNEITHTENVQMDFETDLLNEEPYTMLPK
ncbi:hypothetical protein WA026_002058 [Henosepilachna vigintioctopunctata]|uniref:Uncharacterized protein n=1 Tax=Henosepilachna vigintioctopunctata TaxID=420089 RepID=A0AAW1US13_9CUCU